MEDDALAPFADLLWVDAGVEQGLGRLHESNEHTNDLYGPLYEYTNDLFAEFSVWDGGLESKHKIPVSPSSQPPVQHGIGITSESPDLPADDATDASAALVGKACAFCLGFPVLTRCPKCNSACYCSTDHQAAHSLIHESSCGRDSTPSIGVQFSESFDTKNVKEDLAPADSELRSEMLELLSMFQAVYEKKSDRAHICKLLQNCLSTCDRIMDRYYRIPQVVAMHEQATSLLQLIQNGQPNECPRTPSQNDNADSASGMSVRDHLKADVKEALDRVDAEGDLVKNSDGGEVVNGVYHCRGIWYCKTHIDREQCKECEVDYRLYNELRRENASGEIDAAIRKEQERLEDLDLHRRNLNDPAIEEARHPPTHLHDNSTDAEDFQSISKDLKQELDRARQKEEDDFLYCFASFQIS